MKISLILSTYNGSKYLIPQLDSLRLQTRRADEVIIRDDKSTDNTCAIIEDYIIRYSLDWVFIRGTCNLGWRNSFYELTKMTSGDIIFFCDQDDIWYDRKIELMSSCFMNHEIRLLIADMIRFNYDDIPKSWNQGSLKVAKFSCGKKWPYIKRPGCVFAFDKILKEKYLRVFSPGDAHDLLVWQIAGVTDSIWHINLNAILFRRHDANSTPLGIRTLVGRIKDVHMLKDMLGRIYSILSDDPKVREQASSFLHFLSMREKYLNDKKIASLLKVFPYLNYYASIKALGADIFAK